MKRSNNNSKNIVHKQSTTIKYFANFDCSNWQDATYILKQTFTHLKILHVSKCSSKKNYHDISIKIVAMIFFKYCNK